MSNSNKTQKNKIKYLNLKQKAKNKRLLIWSILKPIQKVKIKKIAFLKKVTRFLLRVTWLKIIIKTKIFKVEF